MVKNHLKAIHHRMLDVLEEGPITFYWNPVDNGKMSTDTSTRGITRKRTPKNKSKLIDDERKLFNLNQVARTEIIKTLSKDIIEKIKNCKTTKEMWDKLVLLCEGTNHNKENKLQAVLHSFDTFKIKPDEIIDQLDIRSTNILNKASSLGKQYSEKEINNKLHISLC